MRLLLSLSVLLLLNACSALNHTASLSEAEKVSQAEQLVRASLTDLLLANVRQRTEDQLHALLREKALPPEEAEQILQEETEAVFAEEEQRLLDTLVPVYRRYYTADEINQLLSFYQTEVARKSQRVSGRIAAEIQQYVRVWNGNIEETLLERIDARLAGENGTSNQ